MASNYQNQKIGAFLTDLASEKPIPGGGSAAALAGALAAALVAKVTTLTIGKVGYQPVEKGMKKLNQQAVKLQKDLLRLADEDAAAYQALVAAKRRKTNLRQSKREEKIQAASQRAAEIPLKTARKSLQVLKMAVYVSEFGNQNLRSDAFSAIELATAAIYGALENVRVNLPEIKEKQVQDDFRDEIEKILQGTGTVVKP